MSLNVSKLAKVTQAAVKMTKEEKEANFQADRSQMIITNEDKARARIYVTSIRMNNRPKTKKRALKQSPALIEKREVRGCTQLNHYMHPQDWDSFQYSEHPIF